MPRIRTTVVGSYPIPDWLVANPSEQALMDATRVVISTQEQAGVDVVCDGELYRFDINHPETNGMIEYFVRPMDGITQRFSFDDLIAYRSRSGMKFRTRPPGTVIGPIGHGSLDLPLACARAKALATHTFKFTVTGPHMLAKTLINKHYPGTPELAHAIGDALAAQVAHLNADIVQIDEANLPGHPEEWQWAASAMNRVLDAVPGTPAVHLCFGNYGGQTVQKGHLGQADQLPERAARGPRGAGVRAPPARGAAGLSRAEAGDRLRPGRGRHQGDRRRERRPGGAGDRAGREGAGGWKGEVHPPGLRVLDAEAADRGREDAGADAGAG
jgi:methionine synthase II (cobalamin-independent)